LNLTAGPHLTQPLPTGSLAVTGAFVDLDNERCYRIANSHLMPDFLMTVASPSDHWMFLSSRGAVTAGRKNPDTSLFPYYSADKIIDAAGSAGPLTLIRGRGWNGRLRPWEPFSKDSDAAGAIRRNLYKNGFGNKVYLEEINDRLGLTFQPTVWLCTNLLVNQPWWGRHHAGTARWFSEPGSLWVDPGFSTSLQQSG